MLFIVYVEVHMGICVYVCIQVCPHRCIHVEHLNTSVHSCTYVHMCMCMLNVWAYLCVHVCLCVCVGRVPQAVVELSPVQPSVMCRHIRGPFRVVP